MIIIKLFVASLPWRTDQTALTELFSQFGQVISAQVITDRETGRSRGFGFVEMNSAEDAQKAMQALNGSDFEGRKIFVNEARPKR